MGGCLSSGQEDLNEQKAPSSAYVVSANGELHQYTVPVKASKIILSETSASSPDNPSLSIPYFICNSDRLNFDEYIPSLGAEEELECGQIYFVLPETKLQYRLAASEMAALAVKAGAALEQINRTSRRKRKFSRISPENSVRGDRNPHKYIHINDVVVSQGTITGDYSSTIGFGRKINNTNSINRTSSFARRGKLTRYSSRRAKLGVRSFKIKLSTVYEGSVLSFT